MASLQSTTVTGSVSVSGSTSHTNTPWTTLTTGFTSPFGVYTTSTTWRPSYCKYNGIVELRGLVRTTSQISANQAIFTLPTGYRPTAQVTMYLCPRNGTPFDEAGFGTRLQIYTSGVVYLVRYNTRDYPWLSIAGITFVAG